MTADDRYDVAELPEERLDDPFHSMPHRGFQGEL